MQPSTLQWGNPYVNGRPELMLEEIDELRAKIAQQTIQARQSGAPVAELTIVGGPLHGITLALPAAAASGTIGWRVATQDGPVSILHTGEGSTLRFISLMSLIGKLHSPTLARSTAA